VISAGRVFFTPRAGAGRNRILTVSFSTKSFTLGGGVAWLLLACQTAGAIDSVAPVSDQPQISQQDIGAQPTPSQSAEAPQPAASTATGSNLWLDQLFRRLDQQDAEIRRLQWQIGQSQSGTRGLPPLTESRQVVPAGYAAELSPAVSTPSDVQFQVRPPMDATDQHTLHESAAASADPSGASVAPDPKGYEVGTDKVMTASWNNGLELKSKNGDFRLKIGGLVQYDINWFDPDSHLEVSPTVGGTGPIRDSTEIRRARITLDGTMYEVFDFRVEFDLANDVTPASATTGQPVADSPALTDLWVQWTHLPVIGIIRAGNQKEAMGLEHLQAPKDLSFLEPSYLNDMLWGPFNGGFNPGVAILNNADDQRMTWEVGVWGNNSNPFGYSIGEDWAFTGRTTYLLYYDEPTQGRYLWEVGTSGSARIPDEGTVRIRTRGDIRSGPPGVLNPIYADTGVMEADQQNIFALETFAQWGPWSLQAEWAGTWVENAVQPTAPPAARVNRGTPFFDGGYVELWYFLTGDSRVYNKFYATPAGVVPMENAFWVRNGSGCCAGWGAWQVGVRYNAVDLNDNGINGGTLNSFTFGVNWFLNPNTKWQFNYDFTNRGPVKTVAAGDINSSGTRFQYSF
jgi:phosphate-selective porin OprO/OprP